MSYIWLQLDGSMVPVFVLAFTEGSSINSEHDKCTNEMIEMHLVLFWGIDHVDLRWLFIGSDSAL